MYFWRERLERGRSSGDKECGFIRIYGLLFGGSTKRLGKRHLIGEKWRSSLLLFFHHFPGFEGLEFLGFKIFSFFSHMYKGIYGLFWAMFRYGLPWWVRVLEWRWIQRLGLNVHPFLCTTGFRLHQYKYKEVIVLKKKNWCLSEEWEMRGSMVVVCEDFSEFDYEGGAHHSPWGGARGQVQKCRPGSVWRW